MLAYKSYTYPLLLTNSSHTHKPLLPHGLLKETFHSQDDLK